MSASSAGSCPAPADAGQPGTVITVTINDQLRALAGAATVATLATELGISDRKGIAVAVNGSVVPRSAWPSRNLAEGDRILIIRATQGG